MKHTPWMTAGLLLAGCHDHHDYDHHGAPQPEPVPVFDEIEPNDFASEVDHFGVILPGDRFAIRGHVRNDAGDPADGFGFTASEPIHVEFRLLADNPFADMAVALYDPQIDQTVFTYQSGANPELGSVDVFAGGVDFHLVVVTSLESTSYELELQVFALQPAARVAGGDVGATALVARADGDPEPVEDALARRLGYYARTEGSAAPAEATPGVLERLEVLELAPTREETTRSSFFLTTDGTWMGIPGGRRE